MLKTMERNCVGVLVRIQFLHLLCNVAVQGYLQGGEIFHELSNSQTWPGLYDRVLGKARKAWYNFKMLLIENAVVQH